MAAIMIGVAGQAAAQGSGSDPLRVALVTGGCTGCHGATGEGGHGIPSIAQTKSQAEFIAVMKAFRDNQGSPTVMNRISRGYTDEELVVMAVRFAKPN
jgi:sulfide dehydrogenase cytochrome subunit